MTSMGDVTNLFIHIMNNEVSRAEGDVLAALQRLGVMYYDPQNHRFKFYQIDVSPEALDWELKNVKKARGR